MESQEVLDAELSARVLQLINVTDNGLHSQVCAQCPLKQTIAFKEESSEDEKVAFEVKTPQESRDHPTSSRPLPSRIETTFPLKLLVFVE